MDNLSKQGWFLTESGLKTIESSESSKNLSKILLDWDLREIGAGIADLHKGKFESLDQENAVLQIQKIRNISAPKANESSKTAPKLLKLQLTDGVNTYSAIEMEPTALSIETKPGTKILLKVKQMKMANGQLLFTPKNTEILGGNVETLVSKWELTKSLAGMKSSSRTVVAGGPPPFIPFGIKIQQNLPNDQRGFKSLQASKPKENEVDDSEFKAQRKDAIAEANKAGTKKTFGGGSKVLVDSNVQKIMDKGYTEEQATTALKYSRNNVEKALGIIKRKEEHRQRAGSNEYEPREYSKEKRGGGKGSSSEPHSDKPSGAVSLFDFLENKIPANQDNAAKQSYNERFENNMSSSFRKFDKDVSNGSQHWSQNTSDHKSSHNAKNSNPYNSRDYRGGGSDQPRDYRNHRDSRDSRDVRDSDSRRDSKYQQTNSGYPTKSSSSATNQYQKPSSAMNNGANNSYSSSSSKGKFQKPDYNNKPGSHRDYNNYATTGGTSVKVDSNSNRSRVNNAPSKYYNDHQSNDYHKSSKNIVESMEKMNLKGNNQQYKGADSNNYPPLAPSTEAPKQKVFSKPGYQIIGFQSKEANEHAKNALKTKNIPGAQQQLNQQQSSKPTSNWQHQQQAAPQHKMPVISQQTIKNQPPPPFPNAQQPAPAPLHSLPQPFVQHQAHSGIHPMPTAVMPAPATVFHPINYPTPIMLQSMPPPGMVQPTLKTGDMCLAKYWEDAQYYNAKITNISDSTYVVLFTEYGNAEEVRKTDCLPLIAACQTPPHASFVQAPQISSAYGIPTQKVSHNYQRPPPTASTIPYKNGQGKNHRRN